MPTITRAVLLSAGLAAALATAGFANPTNAILFVTQVPIPNDFASIGSTFGNQSPELDACGRGGDLYIRYPDGSLKNLTRAAGYGKWGAQDGNGIAVRQPCVHWSGRKAVFSMVIGAPHKQFDYTTPIGFWQLYEITNFTDPNATPLITKVPRQPTNFNNIAPIYGSDDRIIFTTDRPRNGETQLYPQLDEYEERATVTGLWSLNPATGDLFMINHTPSGAFSPLLDGAGRIVFVRWDHLQRDQQADTDFLEGTATYGCFNWSDESSNSVPTTNQTEIFPEPRSARPDLLAGTGLAGNDFNQFFPWAIDQDGTDEETVNHIGRHEIGGSYARESFTNDANLADLYYYGNNYNTNTIDNFLNIREDPRLPGLFYGIDAPEFGTHSGGQLVSLTGATNINAFYMTIQYLTPRSTHEYASSAGAIPPDHTGFYRNPLMTSDGCMIASHTAYALYEPGSPSSTFPGTPYDFRLKFLVFTNGFYTPGATLTPGLTNNVTYWTPDELITQTNTLWELDPVEVIARPPPPPFAVPLPDPERAAFAAANVNVNEFQRYLVTHQLALIVSRDVTTRDHADHLQPYNLRIAGSSHQTAPAPGKIYDVGYLQIFQADQLRGLNFGDTNSPRAGRRVLAQHLHDPAVDNPSSPGAPAGSVRLGPDGSSAALVPARRAVTWQLTDTNGAGVVRERYWLTFAAGEIRSCTSCHGINETDQAGRPAPTNTPLALISLLNYWKSNVAVQPGIVTNGAAASFQITFIHRPSETGVTYHIQSSPDLQQWTDIATYAGTNSSLTVEAREIARAGSPDETVTVRDLSGPSNRGNRFLRLNVTRP